MNQLVAFIRKEFKHIFRDYRTMMILFVMPVAQLLIFGYVVSTDIREVHVGILDHAKDNASREITQKLVSSGYFKVDDVLDNDREIEPAFKRGRLKMVVVFEPGFSQRLEKEGRAAIQFITDASDANTARLLTAYGSGIVQAYANDLSAQKGTITGIQTQVRMFYNEELLGVFMSVPGLMALILMIVSAMMTSISITREKEFGSMEVLLISPLRPSQIIIGKVTPYLLLAFINALTILAMGHWVFQMPVYGSLPLLLGVTTLFTLVGLSLGIFISTVAANQLVAMFISMFALMLPTILLSGFIYPVENMPWPLQLLSHVMPPKWFIIAVKRIMLQGGGIAYVWKEVLVLVGFVVFFILLSIKKFQVRMK
ncbi:MAG: ABC transporter permease [Breznakibacter sp.]